MTNPEDKTIGEIKAEPMEKPEGYDKWCESLTFRRRRVPDFLGPEEDIYVIGYPAIMALDSGTQLGKYCNYWLHEHDYELLISAEAFHALLDRVADLELLTQENTIQEPEKQIDKT